MKAFHFSLESVLRWRSQQLEAQRWELEKLHAERKTLLDRQQTLSRQAQQAGRRIASEPDICGAELQQLQAYQFFAASECRALARLLAACELRIEHQRRQVLEAERKERLLKRLRDRRQAEWQSEVDREWESVAAETYLASRRRRPA